MPTPSRPPVFQDNLPRVFYWYDDFDPATFVGILPKMRKSSNPKHRAMADSASALVDHLQKGRPQAAYKGTARCRICGEALGSRDMTNTVVCWPEGTEHYITEHGVWTRQHSWLAAVVLGRVEPSKPPPQVTKTWADSGAWEVRLEAHASDPKASSDEGLRRPESGAEKIGLKVARAMAKVWEAGDLDELVTYMYSVLPVDMQADLIGLLLPLADPSLLPAAPAESQLESSVDLSTYRPMTVAEMWENAANNTDITDGDGT